jgi:hypothetical protein
VALSDAAAVVADHAPASSLREPEPYSPEEIEEAVQGLREMHADGARFHAEAERALAQARGMATLASTARHAPLAAAAEEMCRMAEDLLQATAADGKVDDEAVEVALAALTAFGAAADGLRTAAAALDAVGD